MSRTTTHTHTDCLGRITPPDWRHVERYPISALSLPPVSAVEHSMVLPPYRDDYDQGREGACVGFSCSWLMSIVNKLQTGKSKEYDPIWLWNRAKETDEWEWTKPGDNNGTSVRAAFEILRTEGHVRIRPGGKRSAPDIKEGIQVYRWAHNVNDVRVSIANDIPVVLGINWYQSFYEPVERPTGPRRHEENWIALPKQDWGKVVGGHAICIYGASDKREAFHLVNSWGEDYPLIWMPYESLDRLMTKEGGEAGIVTDR
jgi:hypothetical protein